MNRRTTNTASSVDDGIEQKKGILDTIVGSTEVSASPAEGPGASEQLERQDESTGESQKSHQQVDMDSESGQQQVQARTNGENTTQQMDVHVTSDNDLSKGLAAIAELVVKEVKAKKTKRETHKKATYELPIELLERFDRIASRMKDVRGFKEKTIQHLLEQFCDAMEAQEK